MLDIALAGSAFLMGAAGSLHCAGMCAAPCAAVTGGVGRQVALFHLGRLTSYAAGGAAVALSLGGLLRGDAVAWLRPLWLIVQLGVLALGLSMLWRAVQPAWMQRMWGTRLASAAGLPLAATGGAVAIPAHRQIRIFASENRKSLRSAGSGIAWLAWPCGLLQSALMVATLASGAWAGAAVMAAFAAGSSPGLIAGPWLLRRLGACSADGQGDPGDRAAAGRGQRAAMRLSGALLASGALWALGHGVWMQIRAFCG